MISIGNIVFIDLIIVILYHFKTLNYESCLWINWVSI